jgi:nucleoside phosphorylase
MHMLGLTSYADLTDGERDLLPTSLFSIQLFDSGSEEWRRVLKLRIQQIQAVRKHLPQTIGGRPQAELGIICALDDPEMKSVLALPWRWQEGIVPGDPTIYHEGTFVRRGTPHVVVAATAPRMGLTAAAITTAKLISAYRPRHLVMVGIAAGVPNKCQLGDVIAADPVWDWGAGKWASKRRELAFLPSPHQIAVEPRIRNLLRKLSLDTAALASVKAAFGGPTPATELCVRVGPLASGAAVLADGTTMARIIEHQHRDMLGVEMEAYGVVAAALESSMPPPVTFVLKSVVDFANTKKHDDFQRYGAYTSASVMALFVQHYLD